MKATEELKIAIELIENQSFNPLRAMEFSIKFDTLKSGWFIIYYIDRVTCYKQQQQTKQTEQLYVLLSRSI